MSTRPFDMFAIVGAEPRRDEMDYRVVPGRGVAAMSMVHHGSAHMQFVKECAALAANTIPVNCSDDPKDMSIYIRDYERPLRDGYTRHRLVASMHVANKKICETLAEAEFHTTASLTAVMVEEAGIFAAWAGWGVKLHRIRDGVTTLLTPHHAEPINPQEARNSGLRAVLAADGTFLADRTLGAQVQASVCEVAHSVLANDLLVLTAGWSLSHNADAESFLSFLANHTGQLDLVLTEAMHRPSWAGVLPALLLRFNE